MWVDCEEIAARDERAASEEGQEFLGESVNEMYGVGSNSNDREIISVRTWRVQALSAGSCDRPTILLRLTSGHTVPHAEKRFVPH